MILGGSGTVRIGDEEAPVRAGHVVSAAGRARGSRTRSAPAPDGLEYLAYGQRNTNDIVYYPDSGKVVARGASA